MLRISCRRTRKGICHEHIRTAVIDNNDDHRKDYKTQEEMNNSTRCNLYTNDIPLDDTAKNPDISIPTHPQYEKRKNQRK